jgi:hypothetical protein
MTEQGKAPQNDKAEIVFRWIASRLRKILNLQ